MRKFAPLFATGMKVTKRIFWGFLSLLSFLWWLADSTDWSTLSGIFAYRGVLMQYSGVMAIGVMSVAMILSARPILIERPLDGLDKMYRLHKWLGIAGLVLAVSHWLIVEGPRWMLSLGWIVRTTRRIPPILQEGTLQHFLSQQRSLAAQAGEYAFYLAALLMVLALIKRFPYRAFFQTHRILAVTYLALVFHSIVFMRFAYWRSPLGALMLVLLGLGSLAAVLSLCRQRAGRRPVAGQICSLDTYPESRMVEIGIRLGDTWPGHVAGQFAFVTLHRDEGPHPFTISSAPDKDGEIRFLVKGVGDYTRTLTERLHIGDPVRVEGPYGRFTFESSTHRQIWIAGGVGIAPFLARLRKLIQHPDGKIVDLFYSTAEDDPRLAAELAQLAERAKVRLHYRWSERDGLLNPTTAMNSVPDWREADVWFCGPVEFSKAMRHGFTLAGLPGKRFHCELFEMR